MAKKIRFNTAYNGFTAGWVIGTRDSHADYLVSIGVASYVADDTRALKYEADKPVQNECIAPPLDEMLEAAPKLATLPKTEKKSFLQR